MCGIFGLIRSTRNGDSAIRATAAFLTLGNFSEERGTDSSGIAAYTPNNRKTDATQPTEPQALAPLLMIDDVFLLRETSRFSDLAVEEYMGTLHNSQVLIGHTRWATQGSSSDIRNASPMLAGSLIGTHNGDVEVKSIPGYKSHEEVAYGGTDSERIYLSLDGARKDRRDITKVLKTLRGRAALVFMDRARPNYLYIARTALSPVSYAYTADGDFMYASNPDWFRQIEQMTQGAIQFTEITLVPEGHLLTVDTRTGKITDVRRFTPTCRERDIAMINTAAYKKFTPEDKAAFIGLHRHKIAANRLPKWPTLTPAPFVAPQASSSAKYSVTAEWDFPGYDEDLPEGFEFENLPPLDVVEELCWAGGDFDHLAYESILTADDPQEAADLVKDLKADVESMIAQGQTFPGFTMPTWFAEQRPD